MCSPDTLRDGRRYCRRKVCFSTPSGTEGTIIDPTPQETSHRDANYAVNLAQARVFARSLAEHIEKCSASIEVAQARSFRARADKALTRARELDSEAATLRRELYEMYRQIDNMTARFPELRGDPALRN
ncbi:MULTISPECIES: hypothetical protein [Nocardiaceae]|uniref:hypothetical protein n=1 Tax=Nocardiaceae TaxID=85025 RepID=UPI0003A3A9C6|nr:MULTISPECIES: hypothetical protein [Rhodococcus]